MLASVDPGGTGACVRLVPGRDRPRIVAAATWRPAGAKDDPRIVVDVLSLDRPLHRRRVRQMWEVGAVLANEHVVERGDVLACEDAFLRPKSKNPAATFEVVRRACFVTCPLLPLVLHNTLGWVHPSTWRAAVLTKAAATKVARKDWKDRAIEEAPSLVDNFGDFGGRLGRTEHLSEAVGIGVAAMTAIEGVEAVSLEQIEGLAEGIRRAR